MAPANPGHAVTGSGQSPSVLLSSCSCCILSNGYTYLQVAFYICLSTLLYSRFRQLWWKASLFLHSQYFAFGPHTCGGFPAPASSPSSLWIPCLCHAIWFPSDATSVELVQTPRVKGSVQDWLPPPPQSSVPGLGCPLCFDHPATGQRFPPLSGSAIC